MEREEHEEEAAREEYEREVVKRGLAAIRENVISCWTFYYADAIEERFSELLKVAAALKAQGHFGPALVSAVTAAEIVIRYLLVRPLLEAAFISEDTASELAERLMPRNLADNRRILSVLLKEWGTEADAVRLHNGAKLMDVFYQTVLPKRHRVAHVGDTAASDDADLATACAQRFRDLAHQVLAKSDDARPWNARPESRLSPFSP